MSELRHLHSADVHFSIILLIFGLTSSVISFAALLLFSSPRLPASGRDRYLVVANGVLSFAGQIGFTTAPKLCEAGKVSLVAKASDIVYAFCFQILLFGVRAAAGIERHVFHTSSFLPFCARVFSGPGPLSRHLVVVWYNCKK